MNADAPSCASHRSAEVVENVRIARDTYRIRILQPEMARAILPELSAPPEAGGRFIHPQAWARVTRFQ